MDFCILSDYTMDHHAASSSELLFRKIIFSVLHGSISPKLLPQPAGSVRETVLWVRSVALLFLNNFQGFVPKWEGEKVLPIQVVSSWFDASSHWSLCSFLCASLPYFFLASNNAEIKAVQHWFPTKKIGHAKSLRYSSDTSPTLFFSCQLWCT